jgi:adenylate kinase family enzyme
MRVVILGNSGSGKSTLAKALAREHGLARLDLDTVVWEPRQVAVARDPQRALADVRRFCQSSASWVVEGCYASLVQAVLACAGPFQAGYGPRGNDTPSAGAMADEGVELVFLQPGEAVCLANCKARPWEPHKYASLAEQNSKLAFLLEWVSDYYRRDGDMSLRAHQAVFDAYAGPKRLVSQQVETPPR